MKIEEIITDKNRLFVGADVPEAYLTDQYVSEVPPVYAVALPKTHEEIVQLVKFAKEQNLDLR